MCSVHLMQAEYITCVTRERDKGATAAPLSIPAAPRGNRCFALRSPPARLTDGRLDSTSCLVSPLAALPGVQSLSSGLRFAGFSGDSTPCCETVPRSNNEIAVGSVLKRGVGSG